MILGKNTVENGVYIDSDPMYQPAGTLRDSFNGRILNVGGGNFVWEGIDGTQIIEGLPPEASIIGQIPARDKLVLFLHQRSSRDICEIGYIEKNSSNVYEYTILYAYMRTDDTENVPPYMGFSEDSRITGYSYYESEDKEYIYFRDDVNSPRAFNIRGITKLGYFDLEAGKTYIFIKGYALYGSEPIMRGFRFSYRGQISHQSSDFTVIEAFDPEIFDWDPMLKPTENLTVDNIDGNLPAGQYLIAHRFVTKNGHATPWTPFMRPEFMNVPTEPYVEYTNPGEEYRNVDNWNLFQSGSINVVSGKGIKITVEKIIQGKYKYLQMCAFRSKELNTWDAGVIFSKTSIDEMNFSRVGDIYYYNTEVFFTEYSGLELTQYDYILQSISFKSVGDLTTVNFRNILANPSYEEDLTNVGLKMDNKAYIQTMAQYVPVEAIYKKTDYQESHSVCGVPGLNDEIVPRGPAPNYLPVIMYRQWYKVTEGYVKYNNVQYGPTEAAGPYFEGSIYSRLQSYGSQAKVVPVLRKLKYWSPTAGQQFEYIEMGSAPFPKGTLAKSMAGYWRGETYRIGLLPISLTGKYMPVRWLGDVTIPTENDQILWCNTNGTFGVMKNVLTQPCNKPDAPDNMKWQQNALYNYLLVTVDLTDIIHEISGFCIVRGERSGGALTEGIMEPLYEINGFYIIEQEPSGNTKRMTIRHPYFNYKHNTTRFYVPAKVHPSKQNYGYICPDNIIENNANFNDGDTYSLKRKYVGPELSFADFTQYNPHASHPFEKRSIRVYKAYSREMNLGSTDVRPVSVLEAKHVLPGEKDVPMPSLMDFNNFHIGGFEKTVTDEDGIGYADGGGPITVLSLKHERDWVIEYNMNARDVVHILERRNDNKIYSDSSDQALEKTEYVMTGHYQKVDDAFKASIKSGNKYIAYQMEIMGGDTYVNLFSHVRCMINGNWSDFHSSWKYADQVIVPLQSKYNLAMKYGPKISEQVGICPGDEDHITPFVGICFNRDKLYDDMNDPLMNASFQEGNPSMWESYSYNFGLLTNYAGFKFPAYQRYSSDNFTFPNRINFSNTKSLGQEIDQFRFFPALNFKDIPGNIGSITNIRAKLGRLFYWAMNGIGYIPVGERALQANEIGLPIQLGTSGEFASHDELYKTYGNQDLLSLIETDKMFYWYDFNRRTLLSMGFSGQFNEESIIKGMDSFFQQFITREDVEVVSGYDPKYKVMFMTMRDLTGKARNPGNGNAVGTLYRTIGLNTKSNKFDGFYVHEPWLFANLNNDFFSVVSGKKELHIENVKESSTIHGSAYKSNLTMIVGTGSSDLKRFISSVFKGNRYFFTRILYQANFDDIQQVFLNEYEDFPAMENINSDEYKFVVGEHRTGIPQGPFGRMEDFWMKVMMESDPKNNVRLSELLTYFNKIF